MLIPKFFLEQDAEFLIIILRLPYVKITNSQFYIEKYSFKFYLSPYYLNLTFKQSLVECEEPAHLLYNHTNYELTCKLKKLNKNEVFEDLGLLTKLMQKSNRKDKSLKRIQKPPLIEVLGEQRNEEEKGDECKNDDLDEKIEREYPNDNYRYGFNDQYIDFFKDLQEELFEIGGLNPEESDKENRKKLQLEIIQSAFDADHYLYDLYDNEEVKSIKSSKILWYEESKVLFAKSSDFYSKEEFDKIMSLPKKEHLIKDPYRILLELIDILYSFCHEFRIMDGELNVESATTINKTSSVLHCFCCEDCVSEVVKLGFLKCLTFSFIRNFEVCQKALEDLKMVMEMGKIMVLKILIKIRSIFEKSEPRYLFNILFIDDFCIFLQNVHEDTFEKVVKEIKGLEIKKNEVDINLLEIEEAAIEILGEEMDQKL